jgi:probable F420-dependent oxidoreductase
MKVSARLPETLAKVPAFSRDMEQLGISSLLSFEVNHDPFMPLMLAAEHTNRVRLMTAIAVAFSRSPMTTAMIAHDLNSFSRGRFILGLGTQIKAHITRRFSMPWSAPVDRIREYVAALHAIWDCWYEGRDLQFEGHYYQHTLMTPVMTPMDTNYGRPAITLAAVGPAMCRTAADIADGIILHSFITPAYFRDVMRPQIVSALDRRGKSQDDFEITLGPFVVTGENDEQWEKSRQKVCQRIAFYGSTPAYRPVLEHQGWGELQSRLWRLSKSGAWQEMGKLIDDDVLDAFAIVAPPNQVLTEINRRYGKDIHQLNLNLEDLPPSIIPDITGVQ